MRRYVILTVLLLVVLSWVPLVLIAHKRTTHSRQPRIHVVPDMDNQPRFKAQQVNSLFADHRAMRPQVPGTVARGQLNLDTHLVEGKVKGEWATGFPMEVTEALMKRGRREFEIYCAPCHGLAGEGNGMIAIRADQLQEGTWVPPTSLVSDTVRERSVGHIYNTITNGIRNMPSYGKQIDIEDRWAIVAYVLALQRGHRASIQDVPEDVRPSLR
jgi:mono/diheme cytochrome c family protein